MAFKITIRNPYHVSFPYNMEEILGVAYVSSGVNPYELYRQYYEKFNIEAIPIESIPYNQYGNLIRMRYLSGTLYSHLDYYLMVKKQKNNLDIDKYLSIPDFL